MKLTCAYVLAYAKSRFSHAPQLSINLLTNLLQCGSFNAPKLGKNRVIRVILSEVKQEKFSIYLKKKLNEYSLIYSNATKSFSE